MLGEQARKGPKPGGKVGQDREMMTAVLHTEIGHHLLNLNPAQAGFLFGLMERQA